MPNELNGPMGAAEGYNGVPNGNVGAAKGGDNSVSSLGHSLDSGTLMAIKAIIPAISGASGAQSKSSTTSTQGSPNKAEGVPAQEHSQGSNPKQLGQQQQSPQSPGVNVAALIKSLTGGTH